MKTSLWLPRIDFRPSVRLRLVCFAHAGGGAAPFLRWAAQMPEGVALCPVRRPGRESAQHEPLLSDVPSIAAGALKALLTLPPRPTVLLGHSLGAAVAFEVARRMEARGAPARALIVSAKPPVHLPQSLPRIAQLPGEPFIDALDATYGGIPQALRDEPELLRRMVPVLRADLAASESYRPLGEPRLSCPVEVAYGTEDRAVDASVLPAWRELTCGEVRLSPYPGGHFYLLESPAFVAALSATLTRFRDG